MWADQNEVPADAQILTGFNEKDIDKNTLQQYRNRFSAVRPEHPWLTLDTIPFLQKLGGWRQDRETREEGFTVAGILMFGTEDAIQALSTQRPFNLDYRERVDESIANRWADRLTIDGTWTPNLFQFYQAVYPRLTNGIKLPFAYLDPQPTLFSDPVRAGMSPVHEAIQEALVNALIHADYSGKGGIILERFADRLELSNPGTLLISMEQLEKGAVSECRNPSLQRMFQMIGSSDKAGSGMDKIWKGWRTQQWRSPRIQEIQQPDRVLLTMPMVSLLPPDSITKLKNALGNQFDTLTAEEVLALVIADTEGCVTNKRLQESTTAHHTDLTKMLQHLVSLQLLDSFGYGRWSSYKLPASITESEKFCFSKKEEKTKNFPIDGENSTYNGESSIHNGESSIHNGGNSIHNSESSIHKTDCDALTDPKLQEIAREIAGKRRSKPQLMYDAIYALCAVRALTLEEIAKLLDRDDVYLRNHFLSPMVSEGVLVLKYPGTPNHPNQAYIAVPAKEKDVDDN